MLRMQTIEARQRIARDEVQVSAIAIVSEEYARMRERVAQRLWAEQQQHIAELRHVKAPSRAG